MGTFEFLTWWEVSRANDKLDEQNALIAESNDLQRQREYRERNEAEQRLRARIAEMFENYSRIGEDSISFQESTSMKDHIYSIYQQRSRYRSCHFYKPEPWNRMYGMIPAGIAIWIAFSMKNPHGFGLFLLLGGIAAFVYFSYHMYQDSKLREKRIKEEEACKRNEVAQARKLKEQFPELTAWGLYLKCYIDSSLGSVRSMLESRYPANDTGSKVKEFYRYFDLPYVSDSTDYNGEFVMNMNANRAHIYDQYTPGAKPAAGSHLQQLIYETVKRNRQNALNQ